MRQKIVTLIMTIILISVVLVQNSLPSDGKESELPCYFTLLSPRLNLSAFTFQTNFEQLYFSDEKIVFNDHPENISRFPAEAITHAEPLAKSYIRKKVKKIKGILEVRMGKEGEYIQVDLINIYIMKDISFGQLGIPLSEGKDFPWNTRYVVARKTEDNQLNLYFTQTFWEKYLKQDLLFLAEIIDYGWQIEMRGMPVQEAEQRAYLFSRKYGLSPRHLFLLNQISACGNIGMTYLVSWFERVLESPQNENMITYDYQLKWHIERLLHRQRPLAALSPGINWDILNQHILKCASAESEEEIGRLLRTCLLKGIGFRGVTIYSIRKNEISGKLQYRSIWREGMKGKRWLTAWKNFLKKDEKYKSLLMATMEKPYLHITDRRKSSFVYAPWLLKDVFLYRFGATSLTSTVASMVIDGLCLLSDVPARLGLEFIKAVRPQWLDRVNESLYLNILDNDGNPLAQILINNWLSKNAEPLFADEHIKEEKLKLLSVLSFQISQAIQLVRQKNKLAETESLLNVNLKALRGIAKIYQEVRRSLHAAKNKWVGVGGFAIRLKRKIPAAFPADKSTVQDLFRTSLDNLISELILAAKDLEEKNLIQDFELNKTKELSQRLDVVLEDIDSLQPKASAISAATVSPKDEERARGQNALTELMFKAASVEQLNQVYDAAMPLYRDTPWGYPVTMLYSLSRDKITTNEYLRQQKQRLQVLDEFLKENLSVIKKFVSVYKPLCAKLKETINSIERLRPQFSAEEEQVFKKDLDMLYEVSADLINTNEAFLRVIDSLGLEEHVLDIKIHDISKLLETSIENNRYIAEKGSCFFVSKIEPNLIGWVAEEEFNLIMLNLFSNAIRYSLRSPDGPSGKIEVTAMAEGEAIAVSVTDEGIGIAPEKITRVGLPFETLDRMDIPVNGSGIGLSYVRAILKKISSQHMDNFFEVSSGGKGKGSTFTVRFPALAGPKDPLPATAKKTYVQSAVSPPLDLPQHVITFRMQTIIQSERLIDESI